MSPALCLPLPVVDSCSHHACTGDDATGEEYEERAALQEKLDVYLECASPLFLHSSVQGVLLSLIHI